MLRRRLLLTRAAHLLTAHMPCERPRVGIALSAAPLLAAAPLLLRRMRGDIYQDGELRTSTAALMWSGYAGHAALTTAALLRRPAAPPLPTPVRVAAAGLVLAGVALDVAGMRRFAGPGQLTGTAAGDLVTGGIYRYSRNPQYLGLIAALAGLALLRRSPAALALTAGLAAAYRAWVPVEEAHLARHFGKPYRRYRATAPRWLGPPTPRPGAATSDDRDTEA